MAPLVLPALVEEFGTHQPILVNARMAKTGMAHSASAALKVNIGTETPAFPALEAKFGAALRLLASANKDINGTAPTASFLALLDKLQSMACVNVLRELTWSTTSASINQLVLLAQFGREPIVCRLLVLLELIGMEQHVLHLNALVQLALFGTEANA